MMKKFMNAPETVTDELLVGLGLAHPDILDVDGHLVISKDLENADRVTIVTYGGSGHEPAQAGFVGKGMLDVQAVGDIFAAPSGQLVFEAMKMADKGHGVLLLTLNYAGDQLAGKQAMKLAKKAGLNFRPCAITVARAAPATPIFTPAIRYTSKIRLTAMETSRNIRAERVFPTQRRTADPR